MATFEAQTMVDPNPGVNALYNAQQGQWIQNQTNQNALLQSQQAFPVKLQAAQQAVGLTDWDAAARAGTALLGMSEDQAAAAYPGMLQGLRAEGFKLPDAPATYPGHAAIQAMVNRGMTVPQQYASGIIMPPGLADTLGRITGTQPPGPTAQTGSTSGGAPSTIEPAALTNASAVRDGLIKRGMDPETATAFAANALHESAANPNTGPGDAGASQGLFMWNGARNTAYQQLYGHTPQGAPLDEQLDFVMHELNGSESLAKDRINQAQGVDGKAAQVSEAYLRPKDTAPEMQRRSATALQLQRQLGGPATATATPATAPAGGGGAPGSYQVASNAPVPPPGSTAPGAPALLVPGSGGPGPRVAPVATSASPASAPVAQNTLVPPAPQRPQVAPAAAAPPATAAPPPATGVNSPQYQQALQLQNQALQVETMYPNSPQAKAAAAALRLRAQQILQTDSVSYDPVSGIGTKAITGERLNAATPNARYVWNEDQGAYVDLSGTHPPVTPPSPRLTNVPGVGVVQSKPGGGAAVVVPMNPAGITQQKAAETAGSAAGTETGKLTAQLADQGRASAQAIGNIDYGMSQLEKAKAGGINTGYFAPWLGTVSAIGKSLGIPPELIGVDPKAVGNIQTAQKTLAVVSGAILQQVLGSDSQITDAKIQHFIHAQPGIETDPDAVGRVLNWARSQFVYEREMAAQGMKDASQTGVLPTNWQANYYDKHGFAPIYNPGTGEMEQPDGSAPSRQPPTNPTTAPVNPAARTVGTTYQTPKGPLKWDGSHWQPAGQ